MDNKTDNLLKKCTEMLLEIGQLNDTIPVIKNLLEDAKRQSEQYDKSVKKNTKDFQKQVDEGLKLIDKNMNSINEKLTILEESADDFNQILEENSYLRDEINALKESYDARILAIENQLKSMDKKSDSDKKKESVTKKDEISYVLGSTYRQVIYDGRKCIEVRFPKTPSESIKQFLKDNYFIYLPEEKIWRGNDKGNRIDKIKIITGGNTF